MEFRWRKSPLVICKILGLFVNTLTANDKYSLLNRHKLFQHLPMELSQKQKNIFQIIFCIFET